MKEKSKDNILRLSKEIQSLAKDLPKGKYHQVVNRCCKINTIVKKEKLWV